MRCLLIHMDSKVHSFIVSWAHKNNCELIVHETQPNCDFFVTYKDRPIARLLYHDKSSFCIAYSGEVVGYPNLEIPYAFVLLDDRVHPLVVGRDGAQKCGVCGKWDLFTRFHVCSVCKLAREAFCKSIVPAAILWSACDVMQDVKGHILHTLAAIAVLPPSAVR